MSIEQTLERIAAALEKLVAVTSGAPVRADLSPEAITALQVQGPGALTPVGEQAAAVAPKRGRPAKTEAPATPVVEAKPVDPIVAAVVAKVAPSFLDDEPAAPVVRPKATQNDVRSALVAVQKAFSPDEAFALLKDASGGAETIGLKTTQVPKGLTEDKYEAVIAAAVKKMGSAEKTVAQISEVPLRASLAAYLGVAA